ncbi:piggyBac transposable element-derived protein 4-like [Procambarus clarkii]|uniref:piggyBac transposable element-derived protein 4-like n=1 Tax=Procambarus clarkii TaxID=6728 RepID=UPI003743B6C1
MKHCVKNAVTDYWSKDQTIPTPFFGKYMSRDRFQILLRCLHFASNEDWTEDDRLWQVRHYMNEVIRKFRDFYVPAQKLVIDESLVLFKGRVAFKQYIPSKQNRFGLKFFVLCDCETGYVLHMILYSASDVDIPGINPHGFSGSVVKSLIAPWMNKGHILYTDNYQYYISPMLARFLNENRTELVGTVKPGRREMSVFDNKLEVGDCQLRKCDQIQYSVSWKDKREVNLLTTVHDGTMVNSGKVNRVMQEPVYKPDCVLYYNINMCLVDKSDLMVGTVKCVQKTLKWTKKVFFHLVDMSMLNSYNMYLVKTGRKPSFQFVCFYTWDTVMSKVWRRCSWHTTIHHEPSVAACCYTQAHLHGGLSSTQTKTFATSWNMCNRPM